MTFFIWNSSNFLKAKVKPSKPITQKLFYLQVRETILKDEIPFPSEFPPIKPETFIRLAALHILAKFGPYLKSKHKHGYLRKEDFVPKRFNSFLSYFIFNIHLGSSTSILSLEKNGSSAFPRLIQSWAPYRGKTPLWENSFK